MRIQNKKVRFNYQLLETLEAGLVLSGAETKAIKAGRASLDQAYIKLIGGEAFLVNANINTGEPGDNPTRSRKLLLKRTQLDRFNAEIKAKNLTLMPTKLYTSRNLIKAEVALAKSKRRHDKRAVKRDADLERDIARELKERD